MPEQVESKARHWRARPARRLSDMAVLARVLEATRANLNVMSRLRDLRAGRLEYAARNDAGRGRRRAAMGTINSAFSIMSQALDADQAALSIVANNVANANTTGYTREAPNWQENPPVEINGISYGAGVTETGATSVRDRVLEERLDQQQQLASASGSRLDGAQYASGTVHAGFGLIQFDGRGYWQRHHQLLQFLFVAGGQSDQQRAAPAGAVDGIHSGRRYLERGGQSECAADRRWTRRQRAWPAR